MKNNDLMNERHSDSCMDFHFGIKIEDEARKKNIPPGQLAETIFRYQYNPRRIFTLDDMDVVDIVKISYLLDYNFLDEFSKKYLAHLPRIRSKLSPEKYAVTFNFKTRSYDHHGNTGKYDFLNELHFGQYVKEMAEHNGWDQQEVANRLSCSQSTISDLYRRKSIKVKKTVRISNLFQHNLIAELYLSRMMVVTPIKIFDQSLISISGNTIFLVKQNDKNFSIQFLPKDENE